MRERGFTLIEVIIVAGMVAVVATVVFTNVSEARKRARDVQRESDLAQLQIALKLYNDVYGTYNVGDMVPNGEGLAWVSSTGRDDEDDGEIELPGPGGERDDEEEIPGPWIPPQEGEQAAQIMGGLEDDDRTGKGETKGGVQASGVDQALYEKGYLTSPVLKDPTPPSRSDYGYMIALCDEGRRYAVYATKEISDDEDISNTSGLCDGRSSTGFGSGTNEVVATYGKNYGVGN